MIRPLITLRRRVIDVRQGCLKGTAPSLLAERSWRQVPGSAYSTQKTSLTSSDQPRQPHVPWLGWGSKKGDLSLSHIVLASCLPHPCWHLGHVDSFVAPQPQGEDGHVEQRVISEEQQPSVPSKETPRTGLLSICGNWELQHMRHLLSRHVPVLSAPHLILLLFSEVPMRYRGLSKHLRENRSDHLGRGDECRWEGQWDRCLQDCPDPTVSHLAKFGFIGLTMMLTLAAVTDHTAEV